MLNLWIMYYFGTKMYSKSNHCNPSSSHCSEACPFPSVSQNAASRNQATGMEHSPTWGWLLTKLDRDFRTIAASHATSISSSFCNGSCVHQAGKIQPNWMMNADTCPMWGKHSPSRKHLRILFKKCLNAFLNRNGLKHKRASLNWEYRADTSLKLVLCTWKSSPRA